MDKLQCYAIFFIPDGYEDYLGYIPKYKKEFFNCTAAGYDTDNVDGIIELIKNCYEVSTFELHWTIFDPDHFKELYYLD